MRVSLIKNDKKIDLILPEQISGSYWITDLDKSGNRKNLISIEAVDNTWHLVSNDDIYVMNNNLIEPYKTLVNNEFTILKNKETNENIILYCSSVLQKYNCYDINSYIEDGFNIGPLGVISSPVLNNVNIVVRKEHDDIVIINDGSKAPIYVNDVRLEGKRKLKNADIVFTQGVMFFIVKKQDVKNVYYLYLNNVDINISAKLTMTKLVDNQSDTVEEKDEIDIPLYEDSDYFHKTPRFIPKIKTLNLSVDAPPSKQEDKDQSILLTIGPMLTMSMTSLVSGYVAVNNVLSGSSTIKSALPSIIMCVAMFASIFIWPTISRRVEARNRKKKEKERQKKYGAYIESKKLDIQKAIDQQSSILNNNYPSIKDCEQIVLNKYTTLWQRRIEDDDYLVINLGVGSYPMKIDIKYPEEHFSLFQDNLKDMVQSLGAEPKLLPNVPIIYSLYDNYITGIIGSYSETSKYLKNVILQCVTHHSYDNLKIVIFTDEEKQKDYEYLSFLPHLFTDDKELRLYATNNDEYKEICYYLDREFNKRSELTKELTKEDLDYTYLIITDSFKAIRNYDVINNIIKSKKNLGFSIVILDKNITDLPTECKSFISIKDGTSEHSMIGRFKDQIVKESSLPITLTSYSPCFRKEGGSHGLEERGLYRVHQFEKQEMIVLCKPEEAMDWYNKMWKYTVEFFRSLDVPVRTLECCSGDLADLKVKSCDVEAWSPRQKKYFEVGSCSTLGDAQARRLGIRTKGENGTYYVNTLNNTVVATPRGLIAVIENNYLNDGSIRIPLALRPYMGGKEIIKINN